MLLAVQPHESGTRSRVPPTSPVSGYGDIRKFFGVILIFVALPAVALLAGGLWAHSGILEAATVYHCVVTAVLLFAGMLERRWPIATIWTAGLSLLSAATGAMCTPLAAVYPTLAMGPLIASAVVLLYLRGRPRQLFLALSLLDALAIVTWGAFHTHLSELDPLTRTLLVGTFFASTAVLLGLLWGMGAAEEAAERLGRRSAASFWSLIDRLPDVVFGMRDRRIVFANPAALELFGRPSAEVLGVDVVEFVHEDEREAIRERVAAAGHGVSNVARETRMLSAGGAVRQIETRSVPMELPGEAPVVLVMGRDVTEKRLLEAQFRQAQKMEAVGRLAGGVAHDFNNLLSIILGYSSAAVDRLSPGDPLRDARGEIRRAGARAAALTRQLLAFSRQQPTAPEILDLGEVVTGLEKMLRRLLGDDVELSIARRASRRIKADANQIGQLLMNLAVNARDAMPSGGKLAIEVDDLVTDPAFAATPGHPGGPRVRLALTDTGVGMDAQVQAHLFEPFFTTKEPGKGTGLGLSIVFGIVKQSGGCIGVRSQPGQGTTFEIVLPAADDAAEPSTGMAEIAPLPRGTETVLLAEDEDALRKLAERILHDRDYRVLTARDGAEALVIARRAGRRDLVVTDVVMPGLRGPELVARLREERPGLRALFLSGYVDGATPADAELEPGDAFLPKPFTPDALSRNVRNALDARRATADENPRAVAS